MIHKHTCIGRDTNSPFCIAFYLNVAFIVEYKVI